MPDKDADSITSYAAYFRDDLWCIPAQSTQFDGWPAACPTKILTLWAVHLGVASMGGPWHVPLKRKLNGWGHLV